MRYLPPGARTSSGGKESSARNQGASVWVEFLGVFVHRDRVKRGGEKKGGLLEQKKGESSLLMEGVQPNQGKRKKKKIEKKIPAAREKGGKPTKEMYKKVFRYTVLGKGEKDFKSKGNSGSERSEEAALQKGRLQQKIPRKKLLNALKKKGGGKMKGAVGRKTERNGWGLVLGGRNLSLEKVKERDRAGKKPPRGL